MTKKYPLILLLCLGLVPGSGTKAQEAAPDIQVTVDLVQLNVAVTDKDGRYIDNLRPENFEITEDGIRQSLATFGEGNGAVQLVAGSPGLRNEPVQPAGQTNEPRSLSQLLSGANVFVLFDTSNYMYRGFVFAQDAIADFVRSLESVDKIALYSYSRDLSKMAPLTSDRSRVLRALRNTVAGDDAALYNCLLLTVKDAAQQRGRKVVVVFSNGPDNASMVPPEDVAELAQSAGTAIYIISTREAKIEPLSSAVFERMTAVTGGKAYFARDWRDQKRAFAAIRDDLSHLYSLSYYPQRNQNRGWRKINVRLVGENLKKYRVRTRDGYRPQPARFSVNTPTTLTDVSPSNPQ